MQNGAGMSAAKASECVCISGGSTTNALALQDNLEHKGNQCGQLMCKVSCKLMATLTLLGESVGGTTIPRSCTCEDPHSQEVVGSSRYYVEQRSGENKRDPD